MYLFSALILGFLGSFHCVAMCSAIAIRVGGQGTHAFRNQQMLYHLGRILSYVSIAALFSSLNIVSVVHGGQSIFSIIVGSLLFIGALLVVFDVLSSDRMSLPVLSVLTKLRSNVLQREQQSYVRTALLTGLINGVLPCGFVYIALASALMQTTVLESMSFMAMFGLGTVPSLVAVVTITKLPRLHSLFYSGKALSYGTAIIGLLLVIRGLALGIPYLSPSLPENVQTLSDIKHETVCGSPKKP